MGYSIRDFLLPLAKGHKSTVVDEALVGAGSRQTLWA